MGTVFGCCWQWPGGGVERSRGSGVILCGLVDCGMVGGGVEIRFAATRKVLRERDMIVVWNAVMVVVIVQSVVAFGGIEGGMSGSASSSFPVP